MPEAQSATPATTSAGPSSTPAEPVTAATAPSTSAPAAAPAAAAPAKEATPPTAPVQSAQPSTDAAKPTQTSDQPLIAIPEDMKIAPAAIAKFDSALRPKLIEGKVSLTPQEVADLFFQQARDANEAWQKQQSEQDKAWEAECRTRFSHAQLETAKTAVSFFKSFDPGFESLAKQFGNHPTFVNAMRIVGERLSEDTFETGGAPPAPASKSRAERMGYAKPKSN